MLKTDQYPRVVRLRDFEFVLRPLTAAGRLAIERLAAALHPIDLLFLDRDITNPVHVHEWIAAIAAGDTVTVLAFAGEKIASFGSLERSRLHWMPHVAEIRLLVAPAFRHRGLGRELTREVFDVARRTGIEKVAAQMTIDRDDAIGVQRVRMRATAMATSTISRSWG